MRPKEVEDDNPVWREQLNDLAIRVRHWTGNHAGIAEVAEEEIARLREEEPPIVTALRDDSVLLFGADASDLLGPVI